MNLLWILFIARRYFRVKRRTSGIASSFIAIGGLTVGVMALITVLSVMNGFQLGFIESILEVSSFHIRLTPPEGENSPKDASALAKKLLKDSAIRSVLPFRDIQTLIQGWNSSSIPCLVRAVPEETPVLDPKFMDQLEVYWGNFDLGGEGGILLGHELAQRLGVGPGDTISLVSMAGKGFDLLSPKTVDFEVRGIFRSGYYEFDSGLAVVSLSSSSMLAEGVPLIYGVKAADFNKDRSVFQGLKENPLLEGWQFETWREYNRAFFGALRLEKNAMMILIGLIFLVVGANIYNAQKRNVIERYEEIGILRSFGASPWGIRMIFLCEGLLIGFTGGILGVLTGLLVTQNIEAILRGVAGGLNFFVTMGNSLAPPFSKDGAGGAPSYFYIPEFPVRVLYGEVLLIFLFSFFSSLLAAYLAGRRVSAIEPSQALRCE